jgi:hypothetical protein
MTGQGHAMARGGVVLTLVPATTPTTDASSRGSISSAGAVAGAVIACIFVLLILIAVARRRRGSSARVRTEGVMSRTADPWMLENPLYGHNNHAYDSSRSTAKGKSALEGESAQSQGVLRRASREGGARAHANPTYASHGLPRAERDSIHHTAAFDPSGTATLGSSQQPDGLYSNPAYYSSSTPMQAAYAPSAEVCENPAYDAESGHEDDAAYYSSISTDYESSKGTHVCAAEDRRLPGDQTYAGLNGSGTPASRDKYAMPSTFRRGRRELPQAQSTNSPMVPAALATARDDSENGSMIDPPPLPPRRGGPPVLPGAVEQAQYPVSGEVHRDDAEKNLVGSNALPLAFRRGRVELPQVRPGEDSQHVSHASIIEPPPSLPPRLYKGDVTEA